MTPSTPELRQALECTLGRIENIERSESPYSSTYPIEELKVLLGNGSVLQVIFKNLSRQPRGSSVKPSFLYNPLREIETYRSILSARSLGTARYFHAVTGQDRYWLFLESVAGAPLWQSGDLETWRKAARWLAGLHSERASVPHLLCYDRDFYARWWQRATALHPKLLPIQSKYEQAVEYLLELPITFLHGEFYPSNVLVDGDRICPIDWEMAACGPAMMDLAALTAGKWDEQERLDFMAAYCGTNPSEAMCHDLECCRLHLAVRWLGWATDWRPPVAQAHDWQREALQVAEGL